MSGLAHHPSYISVSVTFNMVTISGSIRKMFQRIRRDSKPTITEPVTASLPAKHEIQPSTTHLEHAPTTNIQTEALVAMTPGEDFTLLPITLDEVRPDKVLVEMKASGICHTVPPPSPSPLAA